MKKILLVYMVCSNTVSTKKATSRRNAQTKPRCVEILHELLIEWTPVLLMMALGVEGTVVAMHECRWG